MCFLLPCIFYVGVKYIAILYCHLYDWKLSLFRDTLIFDNQWNCVKCLCLAHQNHPVSFQFCGTIELICQFPIGFSEGRSRFLGITKYKYIDEWSEAVFICGCLKKYLWFVKYCSLEDKFINLIFRNFAGRWQFPLVSS